MADETPERPLGQRFSQVYLRPTDLVQDSPKARRRIAAILGALENDHHLDGISTALTAELGVDPDYGYDSIRWRETIQRLDRAEFLDLITLVFRQLSRSRYADSRTPARFVGDVNRIFQEESLRYEVDPQGGVHFKVDQQFAATTAAAIAGMGSPRYGNAKAQFDRAMVALSGANVDGKEGIRGVFNSVECVYKLMFPKALKLTSADAVASLQPIVRKRYDSDPTALRAANKTINSLADWVDACHNYRHEEGAEEPSQPPLDLAVQLISVGAAFLRWLIYLDAAADRKG